MRCFTCYVTDESYFVGWIKRSGSTKIKRQKGGSASLDPPYSYPASGIAINGRVVTLKELKEEVKAGKYADNSQALDYYHG
ncbi:hypothetical protein MNBD_GAMMA10-2693 [hydrothermal vent metagenome]|uniref:Uncharacterized protein n=1 Tax=hydrothermal vent metagenome TaxID=652676 RepID=A0A3B0XTT3_9ZZZZ